MEKSKEKKMKKQNDYKMVKKQEKKEKKCHKWTIPTIISITLAIICIVIMVGWNNRSSDIAGQLNKIQEEKFYKENNITPMTYSCVADMITDIKEVTNSRVTYNTRYGGYLVKVGREGEVWCDDHDEDDRFKYPCIKTCFRWEENKEMEKVTEKWLKYNTEYNNLKLHREARMKDKSIIGPAEAKCSKDTICITFKQIDKKRIKRLEKKYEKVGGK